MTEGEQPPVPKPRYRRPRVRQVLLLKAYFDPRAAAYNGAAAARMAGYKGGNRQLATQASRTLHNPNLQMLMATFVDNHLERALQCLAESMEATKRQAFLTDGGIVYTDPVPDHTIRLKGAQKVISLWNSVNSSTGQPAQSPKRPQSASEPASDLVPRTEEEKRDAEEVAALPPAARTALRDAGTSVSDLIEELTKPVTKNETIASEPVPESAPAPPEEKGGS